MELPRGSLGHEAQYPIMDGDVMMMMMMTDR
jgi:hypothetical protein